MLGKTSIVGSCLRQHLKLAKSNYQNQKYNRKLTTCQNLKFSYFTLVDKPIPQSASINSIVELSSQIMYYPFIQWTVPAEASIIIGGVGFRLLIQLCTKFFENFQLKNHRQRPFYKIIQKLFLTDLGRDIKFYVISCKKIIFSNSTIVNLISCTNTTRQVTCLRTFCQQLFLQTFQFYLSLNFFRGCHAILTTDQFFPFHLHTAFLPSLASHDPKFLLPLVPMALTFLWVSNSRHPFLIHMTRSQNLFYRINLSFMSGLLFVPLPGIYTLGFIGLMFGHLLIRTLNNEGTNLRQEWRDVIGFNRRFIQLKQKEVEKLKQAVKNQTQLLQLQKNHNQGAKQQKD